MRATTDVRFASHDARAIRIKAALGEIARDRATPVREVLERLAADAERDLYVETIAATGINPAGTPCVWCGENTYRVPDDDGLAYCDDHCLDGHVDTWLAAQPAPGWVPDLESDPLGGAA